MGIMSMMGVERGRVEFFVKYLNGSYFHRRHAVAASSHALRHICTRIRLVGDSTLEKRLCWRIEI